MIVPARAGLSEINAQALLALAYNRITIYSKLHPPIPIDLTTPSDGTVSQLVRDYQPAVVISGPAGRITIAPAGMPSGIDPRLKPFAQTLGWGLGLGLLGVLAIGGVLFARR